MTVVNHFYNATTKKYIALFGTMFNKTCSDKVLSLLNIDSDKISTCIDTSFSGKYVE